MNIYLVEFFGTAFFAYVVFATNNPLAIGAALAFVLLLTQQISQGHLNPAIAIALASSGRIQTGELIPYILAQCLGALVALEIYKRFKI